MRCIVLCLVVIAAACGRQRSKPRRTTTPTATGATASTIVRRWRLGRHPVVSIGETLGPRQYTFGYVVGVVRLADGRIAVADAQAARISYFTSDGKYIGGAGGRGEGPGEFEGLEWIAAWGNQGVVAFDGTLARVSVFQGSGELSGSWRVRRAWGLGPEHPLSIARDSSVLLSVQNSAWYSAHQSGYGRDSLTLISLAPAPAPAETLAVLGETDTYSTRQRARGPGGRMGWEYYDVLRPFGREIVAAADGHAYMFQLDDSPLITVHQSGGVLRHIALPAPPGHRLDAADARAYVARALARETPSERKARRAIYAKLSPRRMAPAFSTALFSRGGNLWVRRFCPPQADICTWDVFSATGQRRAYIAVPRDLDVRYTDAGHLLALEIDPDGVSRVLLYRVDTLSARRPN